MEFVPSRRVSGIGGYAFAEVDRLVSELREQGVEPIDFGVGDPSVPTPKVIRDACRAALSERAAAGYPSYIGAPEFRQACAAWMGRRFGVDLDPETEVTATAGSKEAVFHVHEGLVDPGDVVIGPNPGYPPYTRGTLFAEGTHHPYPLVPENGFLPDLSSIPDDVAERARLLWICYPNSPTGALAPQSFLESAAGWCRERDIVLASDEAYSEIHFSEEPPHSALECGTEGVLAFFSLSKRSAMTCYRVGWVAGDERLVSVFRKVKTNVDSGTPTFIQDAAVAALEDEEHVRLFREDYRAKRDIMVRAFLDVGLTDCTPDATLYIWQRAPEGMSSVEFAERLLAPEVAVIVTPGTWISTEEGGVNPGEGYVRLALVPSREDCERAARRIRRLDLG
ncbi:MAG: aminotransferase class I/II-fold pyridoxal phosphate-dependent enzyme [Planctomycetota bacterium]|jgi:LL-diaminopimelate aminotransferase